MKIDVIIPAYNEDKRIIPTIHKLKKHKMIGKIYVVDDGSLDGTVTTAFNEGATVIMNDKNMGKGFSVRHGLREALKDSKAQYFMVYDADGSSQLELLDYFSYLQKPELVITSRERTGSRVINDKFTRRFSSRVFNLMVHKLLPTLRNHYDTQNGAVIFSRDFARLYVEEGTINGFCFTLDYLKLAYLTKTRVDEIPVTWKDTPDSRVKVIRDSIRMFKEILQVRDKWKLK